MSASVDMLSKDRWFAVKVRARREEAIASILREREYDVINPTFTESRRYSDRVRKVRCALFPGYVFVAMDPTKVFRLISTVGVQYVVRTGTEIQPLSDTEVLAVRAICSMDAEQRETCRPHPFFCVGQRVRIEAGPLAGLEGVLIRVKNINRVIVSVKSLNSSVSVEIGHTRIRALESALSSATIDH